MSHPDQMKETRKYWTTLYHRPSRLLQLDFNQNPFTSLLDNILMTGVMTWKSDLFVSFEITIHPLHINREDPLASHLHLNFLRSSHKEILLLNPKKLFLYKTIRVRRDIIRKVLVLSSSFIRPISSSHLILIVDLFRVWLCALLLPVLSVKHPRSSQRTLCNPFHRIIHPIHPFSSITMPETYPGSRIN